MLDTLLDKAAFVFRIMEYQIQSGRCLNLQFNAGEYERARRLGVKPQSIGRVPQCEIPFLDERMAFVSRVDSSAVFMPLANFSTKRVCDKFVLNSDGKR